MCIKCLKVSFINIWPIRENRFVYLILPKPEKVSIKPVNSMFCCSPHVNIVVKSIKMITIAIFYHTVNGKDTFFIYLQLDLRLRLMISES